MTVAELMARFPKIPRTLSDEPLVAEFAQACGEWLAMAQEPSACSTQHDARNQYYLKLIGPMAIHGYGLSSREDLLKELQGFIDRHKADPSTFAVSLLSPETVEKEVKGPGCF
ncbi:MAG: hypothetical protein ABGX83_04195 [Nitrospira sp.]|nr:hypothetical protein [Candidatus Manganitrophaceae bacterium]HIL34714.1 hypothetical protein [Candidatus Manganitrophaceae bacterium]